MTRIQQILLALITFVFAAVLGNHWLASWRVDLTEQKLFTLDEGSINIVEKLQKPVTLKLYFSDGLSTDLPVIRDYARTVESLLRAYQSLAPDKLRLQIIDPEPFSEAEDAAVAAGLTAVPNGVDKLYFGLVAEGAEGQHLKIPFISRDMESQLEYEVSQLIYRMDQSSKPKIGIISSVDLAGGFAANGQPTQPLQVFMQLQRFYDFEFIDLQAEQLPSDLDLLWLVQPSGVNDDLWGSVDQYAMAGGKILLMLDPMSETSGATLDPTMLDFLPAWGIDYDPTLVAADLNYALRINFQGQAVRHPVVLGTDQSAQVGDDRTLQGLESLNFTSAGFIGAADNASTVFTPLLQTSGEGGSYSVAMLSTMTDPNQLYTLLEPDNQKRVLAARVQGEAKSIFDENLSTDVLQVLMIADTDFLQDWMWVQVQSFLGQSILNPFADNGNFIYALIDQMSGSTDLMSLRARGQYQRPFVVVDQLQRQAESSYRNKEQQLQQQLKETEVKLAELQQQKAEADDLVLTDQQVAALKEFEAKQVSIRKELRQVQRQLNQDIDALDARLRVLNILVFPLLLVLLLWAGVRKWQARQLLLN